jgi:phospholipase/lecithinase/hemolysin
MSRFRQYVFSLAAFGLLASVATAGPFSDLVVFGDSLSDMGNISQATFGAVPGQHYVNGQFSNGPVYVEALAEGLGLDSYARSTAGGSNFAYGGAQMTGTGGLEGLFIRDIDEQVDQFLNTRVVDSDALFLLFAGANDLIDSSGSVSTPVNNLATEFGRLIADGARQFLVPNLPLLGYTPRYNGNPIVAEQYNVRTADFNAALESMLSGLEASNPELVIHRFDVAGLFGQVIAEPAAFGFTNVTDSAAPGLEPGASSYDTNLIVEEPNDYLFWDDLHPTAAVHAILAEHMLSLFVLAGDYNGNDVIDAADYTAWRDAWTAGSTSLLNDPTPGTVDESDFVYWRDHFGEVLGSGAGDVEAAAATVPEPTGVLLLVIGALLSTVYRGRLR